MNIKSSAKNNCYCWRVISFRDISLYLDYAQAVSWIWCSFFIPTIIIVWQTDENKSQMIHCLKEPLFCQGEVTLGRWSRDALMWRVCRQKMIKMVIKGIHIQSLSVQRSTSWTLTIAVMWPLQNAVYLFKHWEEEEGWGRLLRAEECVQLKMMNFLSRQFLVKGWIFLSDSSICFFQMHFIRGWCFKMDAVTWKCYLSQHRATSTCPSDRKHLLTKRLHTNVQRSRLFTWTQISFWHFASRMFSWIKSSRFIGKGLLSLRSCLFPWHP